MNQIEDAVIVGSGPAGAHCASELTRQGVYPVIFDHSHPREKPCGGGISPPVIQMFPFVEMFRSSGLTFGDFKLISCTDIQVVTKGLENGFSISRRYFDQGILDMARQNGARLIKEKVLDVQKKGKIWHIKTIKTTLSAKVLVGADGVNSIVRRKTVGPISRENLALTFGYLATSLEKNDATIKFLAEIPGYIWVFPGKGYSNIGIGCELRYGGMLKALLDDFISSHFPRTKITSKYASMLPSGSNPEFFKLPCAGENWILIGDAAGHVDPISGGGILYALWDGKLAAQAIKINDPQSYDRLWRDAFGKNLEERCKIKDAFYDPLKSTISLFMGLANKTYSWLQQ
ncbi:MAG TPA: NAD(P)/FAD-dependent oxidoreductase [Candidatus Bathyarchaeia archaeon]|nr:NAD(P)/FAD-dependent oxidoreductase [Candidatus Bathyarchaeia archaeon]